MPIQNKKLISSNCTWNCSRLKHLLKPSPSILADTDCIIAWDIIIPPRLVILGSKNDLGRKSLSSSIYSYNWSHPLSITRLYSLSINIPSYIRAADHLGCGDNAHLEASLIHIVDILWEDPIFLNDIVKTLKPVLNKLWVFTFSTLVIIIPALFGFELRMALYIASHPVHTNRCGGGNPWW